VLLNEIIVKRPYFLVKKDMVKMLIDGFTDSFACDVWFHSLPSVKENCSSKIEVLDRTIICIDCLAQQVPTKHLISAAMSKFREVCFAYDNHNAFMRCYYDLCIIFLSLYFVWAVCEQSGWFD
jgi:hypothetical protein